MADDLDHQAPRQNGLDSDNTLLYKIARDTYAMANGTSGDATAANQAAQITAEQAIQAILGTSGAVIKQKQLTGAPSNFGVATADGTVFTLAAGEIGFIQNLDSADALAVKLGASASTSSFSFILAPGNGADDGKGEKVLIDSWVGVVSVATMTGTGRYMAWKQAA